MHLHAGIWVYFAVLTGPRYLRHGQVSPVLEGEGGHSMTTNQFLAPFLTASEGKPRYRARISQQSSNGTSWCSPRIQFPASITNKLHQLGAEMVAKLYDKNPHLKSPATPRGSLLQHLLCLRLLATYCLFLGPCSFLPVAAVGRLLSGFVRRSVPAP